MVGAGLHSTEIQLVAMQPRCRNCLVAGISPDVELVTCHKCHNIALCKGCHEAEGVAFHSFEEDGETECMNHQISLACTGLVVEQGSPLTIESQTDVKKCFQPKDWIEYFNKKKRDFELPLVMMQMAPVLALVTDGYRYL